VRFLPSELCARHVNRYHDLDDIAARASLFTAADQQDGDWDGLSAGLSRWFDGTCGTSADFEAFRDNVQAGEIASVVTLLGIEEAPTAMEVSLAQAVMSRAKHGTDHVLVDGAVRGLDAPETLEWITGVLRTAAASFDETVQQTVAEVVATEQFQRTFQRRGALLVYTYPKHADFCTALISTFFKAQVRTVKQLSTALKELDLQKRFTGNGGPSSRKRAGTAEHPGAREPAEDARMRIAAASYGPLTAAMTNSGMLGARFTVAANRLTFGTLPASHHCHLPFVTNAFTGLAKDACDRATLHIAGGWATTAESDRAVAFCAAFRHPDMKDIPARTGTNDSAPEKFIEEHVVAQLNSIHHADNVQIASLMTDDVSRTLFSTGAGGVSWSLREYFMHNSDTDTSLPDFIRWRRVVTATGAAKYWPTVIGETKSIDVSIAGALPQFHAYAVAVLRALQLVWGEGAVHLGRVVAGGYVQYFVTLFDIDARAYHTRPACEPVLLAGWESPEQFQLVARTVFCWEEASVWLAREQESALAQFTFLMKAAGEEDADDDDGDDGTSPDGGPPVWLSCKQWVEFPESINRVLSAHALNVVRVLKCSWRTVVILCRLATGMEVVAKLYENRPAAALRALAVAATATSDVLRVQDEFATSLGYVVVCDKVPPVPDVVSLSREQRVALSVQLRTLVAKLHACDVFHGDLHVDNLSWDTEVRCLRLIDFDTARVLHAGDAGRLEWSWRDDEGVQHIQTSLGVA